MHKKGCLFNLRIFLLFFVFFLLCLYFIIPRYTISSPVVFERIENYLNRTFEKIQLSVKGVSWNTLADLSLKDISCQIAVLDKPAEKNKISCSLLHILLPPEAFLTTDLNWSQKNISFTRIQAENILLDYNDLQIYKGDLDCMLFSLPFLTAHRKPVFLILPFQGCFTAQKIGLSSNIIEKVNVFFENTPDKHLISKGYFLWKGSPFVFVSNTIGDETNIYLTGKDIDVKDFISEKIIASSFFGTQIHIQLQKSGIMYLSAVFRPQESGTLEQFDIYAFTKIIPESQIKQVTSVLDTFQGYPYTSGLIEFEYKESDFTMEFQFAGEKSRYQPHLTVPIHNVKEAHQFIKLKLFPTFLREFSSIIPYLN